MQFIALPPIQVVVHQCECVRCSSCNLIRRAQLPDKARRHHPTAISMVALMKYGSGFPFHRLERFLGHLGLSLRASTQFEMVAAGISAARPVYEEMSRLGLRQGQQLDKSGNWDRLLAARARENQALKFSVVQSQSRGHRSHPHTAFS